jgi:hypothetical protein
LFGLFAGLAATFQAYLISLVICGLVTIALVNIFEKNSWKLTIKSTIITGAGSAAGYGLATLVILPHYRSYLIWIKDLFTHKGTYGSGPVGIPNLNELFSNFLLLWRVNQGLFLLWAILVLISLGIWLFIKSHSKNKRVITAYLIGINIHIMILLVLIFKHPGHRYLLSVAAALPLLLVAVREALKDHPGASSALFGALLAGLTVLFSLNLINNLRLHNRSVRYFQQYQQEIDEFINPVNEKVPTKVYWTYNTYSHCYALWLGNDFSKTRFRNEITDLCPNNLQYDIWSQTVLGSDIGGLAALREADKRVVLIVNGNNFGNIEDQDFIHKTKAKVRNLGFIEIQ